MACSLKTDSKSQIVSVELRLRSIRGRETEIDGLEVKYSDIVNIYPGWTVPS
jgi:hypothetical protein